MEGRRNTDEPLRVLLADDHKMFRQGLAVALDAHGGIETVAWVPNDDEVPELARELRPDVVVMEVRMPFERSLETLEALRSFPDPPEVVICTMLESPRYVGALAGAGASAYVTKTASAERLVAVVRAAVLDPGGEHVVVGMPRAMLERAEGGADGALSARELEVLLLAARGLPNRQIAAALRISVGTVKRHLANVYSKMGVSSRGEASRGALARDWITVEEIRASAPGEDGKPGPS